MTSGDWKWREILKALGGGSGGGGDKKGRWEHNWRRDASHWQENNGEIYSHDLWRGEKEDYKPEIL